MDQQGIAYIAYGEKARREVDASLETLRRFHDWPVVVAPEHPVPHTRFVDATDKVRSRWAKVRLLDWAPWDKILYLDADTRVRGDLSAGFEILDDGWDMAMAPSSQQGRNWLWHCLPEERYEVREQWGFEPVQLQAGMMFVRRSPAAQILFSAWTTQWVAYHDEDQAAFLRAYAQHPVKIWTLGSPWNGGALINHMCGRCRG